MDWASNIFLVLLMTDITGTIFFLAGKLLGRRFGKDIIFLRFLTEASIFAFLVPFVYIILYLGERVSLIETGSINLFYGTPPLVTITALLGWLWVGMFLALLAYRLIRGVRFVKMCRGNIPEEDEEIFKVFMDICAGFGIEGKVSLCRNDSVDMPCVAYYHGFVVILPLVKYSVKEAEVILSHELCHYLNGDFYLSSIGYLAAQLHVFNPAVHIMMKEMDMLCERHCDRVACKKGKFMFTKQEYFQVILNCLVDDGKKRERYWLFALADDKSDYERRVEYMAKFHVNGGLKKGAAIALAACFLLGSSITSLAAGDGVANAYEGLTEATKVRNGDAEDKGSDAELSRVYDLDPEDVIFMEDGIETYKNPLEFVWNLPPGKTIVSAGFKLYEDGNAAVLIVGTPDDVDYEYGLKDPDAIMWYVEGVDASAHEFTIRQDGRHYFYVTNLSETEELHIEATLYK